MIHAGRTPYDDLWALHNVSFEVKEGETVGVLGRNGSGKSTLLKCICGVLQPTSGQVVVRGKLAGLLELGAGFQPDLTGRENIFLNGSLLGLSKAEIAKVFDDIVAFAELEQFIDNQVKFYSSGMYVRLGFGIAVNVDPDVLVIDEVLAVGDERFQRKCIERVQEFQREGRTIIFVTHSPDQVRADLRPGGRAERRAGRRATAHRGRRSGSSGRTCSRRATSSPRARVKTRRDRGRRGTTGRSRPIPAGGSGSRRSRRSMPDRTSTPTWSPATPWRSGSASRRPRQ